MKGTKHRHSLFNRAVCPSILSPSLAPTLRGRTPEQSFTQLEVTGTETIHPAIWFQFPHDVQFYYNPNTPLALLSLSKKSVLHILIPSPQRFKNKISQLFCATFHRMKSKLEIQSNSNSQDKCSWRAMKILACKCGKPSANWGAKKNKLTCQRAWNTGW